MTPFQFLGLEPDADESAIKRAYAKRLKVTRPDDDPQGFQRLNDAYQAALAFRQRHAEAAAPMSFFPAPASIEPEPEQATANSPLREANPALQSADVQPAQPFNFNNFLQELESAALIRNGNPTSFARWLQKVPELYDLQLKQSVALGIVDVLQRDGLQLVPDANLLEVAKFFDFQLPPWLLERREALWAIENETTGRFGESKSPRIVQQLKQPFRLQRALLQSLLPDDALRVMRLGNRLRRACNGWPPKLDHERFIFATQLVDPLYFGKWRWILIALRSGLVALIPVVLALIFGQSSGDPLSLMLIGSGKIFGIFSSTIAAIQTLWCGARWIQAKVQNVMHGRYQQFAFVPAALGLASLALSQIPIAGTWLAGICILCSLLLLGAMRRTLETICFSLGALVWLAPYLNSAHDLHLANIVIAESATPLSICLFDALYAQYKNIRFHDAAGNPLTRIASLSALFLIGGLIALAKSSVTEQREQSRRGK